MPIAHRCKLLILLAACWPMAMPAQNSPELQQILDRLERLEKENRALAEEVHALRQELIASKPEPPEAVEEKVEIHEQRIAEQAQTKVEASQRFPIRLTGMALFNAFLNSRQNGGSDYPALASPAGPRTGGATVRQTILGLDFRGPQSVWGAQVHGDFYMDFFGGTGQLLNQGMRVRTAKIALDWGSRAVVVGLEKPIFNPREPASLAQVGISPMTGTGNLWLWIPQVRFEQSIGNETTGLRAQIGAVQTRESLSYQAESFELERARPGLEGRFNLFHTLGGGARIEVAPGFHTSVSHVAGASIPSNLFSVDWLAAGWRNLELTGAFFTGQNVGHLGTGGLRQGFVITGPRTGAAIHSIGGWAQLKVPATERLSFHFFSGQHDDRDADLYRGRIGKNLSYGANLFYRLAPNVVLALEGSQVRTTYIGTGRLLNNHYDLALAYQF